MPSMEHKRPDHYQESLDRTTIGVCAEKGWRVLLTCSTCGHGGGSYADVRWSEFTDYPPDMTMRQLAERATFARCGHRGAWIDYRQDPGSGAGSFYPRWTERS